MADTDPQLDVLARAAPDKLKHFAETLIGDLGEIDVLKSRTGLIMLPMRDTAQGTVFHLGEVLVSEAHIRAGDQQGYGMRRGHDLEAAMAMALVDLALQNDVQSEACAAFCDQAANDQAAEDRETLRRVEATRVNMETF
ncbi:Phosphonate metabolism protein PhnG [Pelagimonas phthalicica]|uniref:Phosphonate metabolism protein PhnG n=1 Tax=Pelagimonas phthalicica TaxID=1037362 RepID=A0A238JAF9_9RHOB|nr:phosphonate C-P lyase system protein PhnG [Pelagimonas phthalicica]TDS93828.1 alpha-D-ribose 1-methylphosphonate 5-triphosphate synthase subunit PhnG [Pelagimonas phthalicica]SMX27648.1 Phosphonate metabolism protein PhnG [Pelagimonas phthalicica]